LGDLGKSLNCLLNGLLLQGASAFLELKNNMNYLKMTPTYQPPNRLKRQMFDKIVEIVRENPGLRTGGIAKRLYPDKTVIGSKQRERLVGMLSDLQINKKIKFQDDRYYVVEVE
jgi:hypothetical protein